MKSQAKFSALALLFHASLCGCTLREGKAVQLALFHWQRGTRQTLNVVVQEYRDAESGFTRVMRVSKGSSVAFQYETPDTYLGAIPLSDESGDLLSVWMGGSSYHFLVTGFRGENCVALLETGSKLPPEIISSPSNGRQRPFILATDGVMSEKSENWSTRIFAWDGHVYKSESPVPYPMRFQSITNTANFEEN
jgi:hypothetical protein